MAIENGSAFLLKVGNGAAPPVYQTVAGLRTTQLSVNGEAVNVTTKDSGGWRALLSGAGVRSVSVSTAGIFTGSAAEVRVRSHSCGRRRRSHATALLLLTGRMMCSLSMRWISRWRSGARRWW